MLRFARRTNGSLSSPRIRRGATARTRRFPPSSKMKKRIPLGGGSGTPGLSAACADSAGPDRDNARHRLRFHDDEDRGVRRPAATAFHPRCAQQRQPDRCGRAGIARVARCRLPDGGRRSGRGGQLRNGYGEDLIKAAFGLDAGVIETIAHYLAAKEITPDVSFIPRHRRTRHEGHFRRARRRNAHGDQRSLFVGLRFVHRDLRPEPRLRGRGVRGAGVHRLHPCDLGDALHRFYELPREADAARGSFDGRYRCRAFLLGRKELPLQGAEVRSADEMGGRIVVQGGTMRNDAVVRAFERLTGREVFRSDRPEMMGAFGCALCRKASGRPACPSNNCSKRLPALRTCCNAVAARTDAW